MSSEPVSKPGKHIARSGVARWLLITAGIVSLSLGVLGMALPLLPTTPFLLLSAYCFARSSHRLLRWLMANRLFGEYLRNYRENRGIPRRVKVYVLITLWATISLSAFTATDKLWLRLLLFFIAVCVSIHILRIKTFNRESKL